MVELRVVEVDAGEVGQVAHLVAADLRLLGMAAILVSAAIAIRGLAGPGLPTGPVVHRYPAA